MKHPQKILVFRQSSLGDVILTLPVVKTLSESFPEAAIDYLTKAPYEQIIKHNPAIRNVLTFNKQANFSDVIERITHEDIHFFKSPKLIYYPFGIIFTIIGIYAIIYGSNFVSASL